MLGRSSVHQQQHAGPAPPKTASQKSKETRKIGPKQKRSSASHHRMALGDCGVFSFMHSLQEVVNSRGALQCVGWSVTLFMYVCGSVSKKKRYLCFCFFLILPRPNNLFLSSSSLLDCPLRCPSLLFAWAGLLAFLHLAIRTFEEPIYLSYTFKGRPYLLTPIAS